MLSKRAVMLLQLKFNFFYRRPSIIARNANNYSAEPFLKDHMITHLISSEKDQWTVKMFRDMYERLLLEKQTVVEKQIKLSEIYEQQFLSANTEKMFYQGILHSRAAFESFEGYLRGIIDRSGALGRMAREKLIIQALQRMKKGKTLSPQMEKTLTEIVRCHFKTEVEHLTTEDLQILGNEFEQLYKKLSHNIHSQTAENKTTISLVRSHLNNTQLCTLMAISKHYLLIDETNIFINDKPTDEKQ
ncbi:unnamed protein product [Didymodactylos carnosus]|uniref:Uncharacterized protein n=1 Tax=Didymodactylos carnosus TaxID=1234261 RepID=A0A8S2Z4R1_9BILA|nr:unnamed protein product [Didymodactylos carnosus]